jgi:serine/threonine protein kinase, bacterial
MTTQLPNDRYQIIRKLGAGGFGDTFLAEDTHMPSRRLCVVKCLRPVQANPQINQLVQDRFQREAAILEALGSSHRQIPMLYAYFYGQTDNQFYLVQEWVDGHTLGAVARQQGKLGEAEVRKILVALLPVFAYIHSQGIIHRDVKPENIILRQADQQPVLIDFGAVRETMTAGVNAQGKTTQTIVIGTPGYMASEQSVGRPTFSSDLYSLGMTAIYLLTGKQPHDFENNLHTTDILWQADAQEVSPELQYILSKAISFNPRDRYQTAQELLSALQDVKSTATQMILPPTVAFGASKTVGMSVNPALPTIKMTEPLIAKPKFNLPLIGGVVAVTALVSTLLAALVLRPQESKVVTVTSPSSSPLSTTTSLDNQQSVSSAASDNAEPIKSTTTPQPMTSIASGASEANVTPSSSSNPAINVNSSCSYYAGDAVTGQAVNLDLCSITTNSSDRVGFVYYLGSQRMGSEANCSDSTWKTFSDQQVHHPLSPATQKMLTNVCSRRQSGIAASPASTAVVYAPPTNVRESPDGKILCSINKKVTIKTYGVTGLWYKTDACGAMGVIYADQLKF